MAAQQPVLITGAAGHVGGRLFHHLVSANIQAVRPSFRHPLTLPGWAAGVTPAIGDLRDDHVRSSALKGASTVVHLATRGYSAVQQPTSESLHEELLTTSALARDAAQLNVRKFIFVSSIHVFGDALVDMVDDTTIPLPTNDYGRSRLAIEDELTTIGASTAMQVVILRLTNTFGVPTFARHALWDLLVHDLCRQAATTDRLVLSTNGTGYRNMVSLSDAVDAIAEVVTREVPAGTYLLAGPTTYLLREIAEVVKTQTQQVLRKSPTVEVNVMDTSQHHRFALQSNGLLRQRIAIGGDIAPEIAQLLHYAQNEFGH